MYNKQSEEHFTIRNVTELVEVVTNTVTYLSNLTLIMSQDYLNTKNNSFLQDYPNCGTRNNDTFNLCQAGQPDYIFCNPAQPSGGAVTPDWSVECLWDCSWKVNPYLGKKYNYTYANNENYTISIIASMPKIPEDLLCLNNCTSMDFPTTFFDYNTWSDLVLDCSNYPYAKFLACYLINRGNSFPFVSQTYFDIAVESCIMASLEPKLYPNGNCDQLGVNLRIFNPLLPAPYLSNSFPSLPRGGPGSGDVSAYAGEGWPKVDPLKNRYPWICSLQTSGFNGVHRCGVTLLSGPPYTTIFASAAHCNYLCKNTAGQVVEICCCRNETSPFSCQDSDFCGISPKLTLAAPSDLQIACNLTNTDLVPKGISPLTTILLSILKIINHEKYNQSVGPIGGYDISVYFVNDTNFKMNPDFVWPACLPQPQDTYIPGNRGILSGWIQPIPTYVYDSSKTFGSYVNDNLRQREALFDVVNCKDPSWMRSNTYYPPGTVCYNDVAFASSVQFGVSGSGIVRPFLEKSQKSIRYSWAGPLSLSKGSDYPILVNDSFKVLYNSNPSVFTDARCYLDWIASQYNLTLPSGFSAPTSCNQPSGSQTDVGNTKCISRTMFTVLNETLPCDFSTSVCQLYAYNPNVKPATNHNFFYCNNTNGNPAICANNCPGVDPNAVVVGGTALLLAPLAVATAGAAPSLLGPALGAGSVLAALGLGAVNMNMRRNTCPPGQCRAPLTGGCCRLVQVRGQNTCPSFC
jgi:hypothetical protein